MTPALATALIIAALVGALWSFVLLLLSLPFILVTLGFFILIVNALLFWLAGWIVPGFVVGGFWNAFFGSIIVSLVNWVLSAFTRGADGRIVLVQVATSALLPMGLADDLFAANDGRALALGRNWRELPSYDALALPKVNSETRILELPSGRKLVSLARVPGWPVIVGASVQVGEALSGWYGTLPLYLFFILGPAFAGAGLAVVFVRELDREIELLGPARADREDVLDAGGASAIEHGIAIIRELRQVDVRV